MVAMGLPDLLRRGAEARALREGSLFAVPAPVSDAEIVQLVRGWAPNTHLSEDGRLLFGQSLQLVGPIDTSRAADAPDGATDVYAIVHRRDRPMYEFDADALAAGLAVRLSGWHRGEHATGWSKGSTDGGDCLVYTPRALTPEAALELLEPLAPG